MDACSANRPAWPSYPVLFCTQHEIQLRSRHGWQRGNDPHRCSVEGSDGPGQGRVGVLSTRFVDARRLTRGGGRRCMCGRAAAEIRVRVSSSR
ncbi:hypothetical protein RHCRD62_10503 [Rhodococcus sp. RD6.2]|nr:hypothetical protein RHCRD62_10503 [Rhodococcus sp. RD6.2]